MITDLVVGDHFSSLLISEISIFLNRIFVGINISEIIIDYDRSSVLMILLMFGGFSTIRIFFKFWQQGND